MSEYSKNIKCSDVKEDIKKVFYEYSLDIQLVWLVELILLTALDELKDGEPSEALTIKRNKYRLRPKNLGGFLRDKGMHLRCYNSLLTYRNLFVHAGIRSKAVLLFLLREHKKNLVALANYAGVELNFDDIKLITIRG